MMSDPAPSPDALDVRNVLVPLDGSEFALQAMPTARALAKRLEAQVHAISIADDGESESRLRTLASGALGVEIGDPRVAVGTNVDPAAAIAGRAHELHPCVVCLTTHGRGRLRGAFVGSVARSLLQGCDEPIAALGPMADNPGWSPPAAIVARAAVDTEDRRLCRWN